MAHLVETMFSVREVPWHGLGKILRDYPTVDQAQIASGLTWEVKKAEVCYTAELALDGGFIEKKMEKQYVIYRSDNGNGLGVVGKDYEIYQNSEMWDFIRDFKAIHHVELDTAGSLKSGKKTWVLAKNPHKVSIINDDDIELYFLFNNSFDGSQSIQIAFVPVRVVCNNTLNMAIKGTPNVYKVRHTKGAKGYLDELQEAMKVASNYGMKLIEVLQHFANKPVAEQTVAEFVTQKLFPEPKKSEDEKASRAQTIRDNAIQTFMELYFNGAGTEIPGVKGTYYGLYNAITEYADHAMGTRGTNDLERSENKFSSVVNGAAYRFKNAATNELLSYLKAA